MDLACPAGCPLADERWVRSRERGWGLLSFLLTGEGLWTQVTLLVVALVAASPCPLSHICPQGWLQEEDSSVSVGAG